MTVEDFTEIADFPQDDVDDPFIVGAPNRHDQRVGSSPRYGWISGLLEDIISSRLSCSDAGILPWIHRKERPLTM